MEGVNKQAIDEICQILIPGLVRQTELDIEDVKVKFEEDAKTNNEEIDQDGMDHDINYYKRKAQWFLDSKKYDRAWILRGSA